MTKVVNARRDKYTIDIRRGTPYGNPFIVGIHGNRQECISQYEADVRDRLKTEPEFKKLIMALDGQILGCSCRPLLCHGDVLVKILEELKAVLEPQ